MGGGINTRRTEKNLLAASNGAGVEVNAEMANFGYEHKINLATRMQDKITKHRWLINPLKIG